MIRVFFISVFLLTSGQIFSQEEVLETIKNKVKYGDLISTKEEVLEMLYENPNDLDLNNLLLDIQYKEKNCQEGLSTIATLNNLVDKETTKNIIYKSHFLFCLNRGKEAIANLNKYKNHNYRVALELSDYWFSKSKIDFSFNIMDSLLNNDNISQDVYYNFANKVYSVGMKEKAKKLLFLSMNNYNIPDTIGALLYDIYKLEYKSDSASMVLDIVEKKGGVSKIFLERKADYLLSINDSLGVYNQYKFFVKNNNVSLDELEYCLLYQIKYSYWKDFYFWLNILENKPIRKYTMDLYILFILMSKNKEVLNRVLQKEELGHDFTVLSKAIGCSIMGEFERANDIIGLHQSNELEFEVLELFNSYCLNKIEVFKQKISEVNLSKHQLMALVKVEESESVPRIDLRLVDKKTTDITLVVRAKQKKEIMSFFN